MMLTTATIAAPTSQAAADLWHCPDPQGLNQTHACTRIKNAPSSGVRVLDRNRGWIFILYNGNSVALSHWYKDTSGKCGVHGDPYVWNIEWRDRTGYHWAYIGDWYLATGAVSEWNWFTDYRGNLGNSAHDAGTGRGTCDEFPIG
jgi:hypothetical protein